MSNLYCIICGDSTIVGIRCTDYSNTYDLAKEYGFVCEKHMKHKTFFDS